MKRNNIFLLVIIIIILSALFFGCTSPSFDDLEIVASNVDDVMVGTYTLDYTITNIEELSENYEINLEVYVVDKDNKTIEVTNNRTFEVVANNVYYVQIKVSGIIDNKFQSKKKDIVISAITTDPKLILQTYILDVPSTKSWKTIELKSGQSALLSALPEIPDFLPGEPGIEYTITKKEWVYFNNNKEYSVTDEYLTDIKRDLTLYAKLTYTAKPRIFTITFETNGGSEIDSITKGYNSSIDYYAPVPTKENCFFLGWYEDIELTQVYVWENVMRKTCTLYAKWEEYNPNNTDTNLFTFVKKNTTFTDIDRPYEYYEIKAKEGVTFPENVVVPNGYNNCPVSIIADSCFANHTEIKSITLPKHIITVSSSAFSGCTNLNNVSLNEGITRLETNMFEDCVNLETLNLPNSVTIITSSCFNGCENLSTLNINKESMLKDINRPTAVFIDTIITSLNIPKYCNISSKIENKNGETIQLIKYVYDDEEK